MNWLDFYPEGSRTERRPMAYLWARTIQCEGPGCGIEIPLIRNMQLTRRSRTNFWHFEIDGVRRRAID